MVVKGSLNAFVRGFSRRPSCFVLRTKRSRQSAEGVLKQRGASEATFRVSRVLDIRRVPRPLTHFNPGDTMVSRHDALDRLRDLLAYPPGLSTMPGAHPAHSIPQRRA